MVPTIQPRCATAKLGAAPRKIQRTAFSKFTLRMAFRLMPTLATNSGGTHDTVPVSLGTRFDSQLVGEKEGTMSLGHVKECHNPRNDECPHNFDARFDCTCKSNRVVNRKPFRLVRVSLRPEFVEGRMKRQLAVEVYPDGLLRLRESGRRRVYETNLGRIYRGCVWREAMLVAQASKAAKKNRKKKRHRR
jgi:hypothetical protein